MKSSQVNLEFNKRLGRRYQVLAGRGATVLWAALEAIAARDGRRGEVIIPDILCPSVLEAVLAAGFVPHFAEVDPENYALTPEIIRSHLSAETCVVVLVHLFGQVAPVKAIKELLDQMGIYLIEDAVQAIGGHLPSGEAIGAHGNFSFIAFDTTKHIRGRGAVLLYDDERWSDPILSALKSVDQAIETPSDQLLNLSWRDTYHGLGQAVRQGKLPVEEASRAFRSALPVYRPLLFRAFDDGTGNYDLILHDWNSLHARITKRNLRAKALKKALSDLPIFCPEVQNGDAIWRYTVQFPTRETADRFLVALRRHGGLVSNLYYPLHQLYSPDSPLPTRELAPRLVNLWVDESVDDSYEQLVAATASQVFSTTEHGPE
jgi:dTDP-4-amino-4,6-dideoxygalactose transaminase